MSPELSKTIYSKLKNFQYYSANYLKIKDKKTKIVPFRFNKTQQVIEEVRAWAKENGHWEWYLFLKARQKGVSTYWEGDIVHRCSTSFNKKAAVLGHKIEASQNLFQIATRFYNNLPNPIRPKIKSSTEKKLHFAALDSELKVMTAGIVGDDVGRSDTINYLHATEVSSWHRQKSTLSSLLATVPKTAESLVVIETTAKGFGDDYYNRWQKVYADSQKEVIIPNVAWKSKHSRFIAIFISWLIDDEYTARFNSTEERDTFKESLTDAEKTQMKRGATLEHLNWRRFAIVDEFDGDEELFKQEYPSTPEEAFLVSGRPVFNPDVCYANYQQAEQNEFLQGDLVPVYDGSREYEKQLNSSRCSYYDLLPWMIGVEWQESRSGYIRIYESIEVSDDDNYRFASGWDVAEGLAQGDFTTGAYLDRKTMRIVLRWHGHIDPDLVAEEQHKISLFLKNKDYICTERNNHGLTSIAQAYRLKLRQYFQEEFGKGYTEGTDRLGFKTDGESKRIVIDDLNEFIREYVYEDPEVEFWGETLTYVKDKKGKMGAEGKAADPEVKCYDDRVMSRALMVRCHKWMPKYLTKADKLEREERTKMQQMKKKARKRVKRISSFS